MTASPDKGLALINDLEKDARHLADNERVSEEQKQRVMGRIGLLLCDLSRNVVSNEEARDIAVKEAERVAQQAVNTHIIVCRRDSGMPSSWRAALMIAVSKSPWALAFVAVAVLLKPGAIQLLNHLLP